MTPDEREALVERMADAAADAYMDNEWMTFTAAMRAAIRAALAVAEPVVREDERGACAKVAETCPLPSRLVDGGPMAGWQTFPHEWPKTIAAAIRALRDADD